MALADGSSYSTLAAWSISIRKRPSRCRNKIGEFASYARASLAGAWSEFFLNDTPLGRRPWLHRRNHKLIDSLLERHSAHCRIAERRHPEEFASTYLTGPRGSWGVPNRNPLFTGALAALLTWDGLYPRTRIG